MKNEITITVENKHFGGYEEKRIISSKEEMEALRSEMKKHPQARDFSTTITLSGTINGEYYFEQIL